MHFVACTFRSRATYGTRSRVTTPHTQHTPPPFAAYEKLDINLERALFPFARMHIRNSFIYAPRSLWLSAGVDIIKTISIYTERGGYKVSWLRNLDINKSMECSVLHRAPRPLFLFIYQCTCLCML